MNMYTDFNFVIKTGTHVVSDSIPSKSGVIQGDVLSPLLFLLFINDLPDVISNTKHAHLTTLNNKDIPLLAFADDVALMSSSPGGLQKQLNALNVYCNEWRLTVNTEKTKVLVFKGGTKLKREERWFYSNERLSK